MCDTTHRKDRGGSSLQGPTTIKRAGRPCYENALQGCTTGMRSANTLQRPFAPSPHATCEPARLRRTDTGASARLNRAEGMLAACVTRNSEPAPAG